MLGQAEGQAPSPIPSEPSRPEASPGENPGIPGHAGPRTGVSAPGLEQAGALQLPQAVPPVLPPAWRIGHLALEPRTFQKADRGVAQEEGQQSVRIREGAGRAKAPLPLTTPARPDPDAVGSRQPHRHHPSHIPPGLREPGPWLRGHSDSEEGTGRWGFEAWA